MEKLLTYGLSDSKLKHISEVANGLACNCICPNCKHPLVAKNNPLNIKAGHFAHYSIQECEGAIETALHILAKEILLNTKKLKTPNYHYDYNPSNINSIFKKSREITFDKVFLEKPINIDGEKVIPDAICEINNRQIYIEFAFSHFIDETKRAKLKKSDTACIEINLKEQLLDEEFLKRFFISDSPDKYWITNSYLDQKYLEAKNKKIENDKKISEDYEKWYKNNNESIIKQQLANEKWELENNLKKKKYQNKKPFKLRVSDLNGKVTNCPLKKFSIKQFIHDDFYRHPILKRIIDGEYWNGIFYGRIPNGKYIFLGKEKVIIYHPSNLQDNLSVNEKKMNNLLYAGLQAIKDKFSNPEYGNCNECDFKVDDYYTNNRTIYVCRFNEKDEIN